MTSEPDLYVGKEPATFEVDGSPVFIGPNVVVRAGHPIMKGRESLFEPLTVHYEVEPAPAEPPPQNAPVADWRAYAVSCGMSEEEASRTSKEQLVGKYGRR